MYSTLDSVMATRTTEDWLEICRRASIPAAKSADLDDIIDALPEAEHPVAGPYKLVPPPVRFSKSPASVRIHAPLIGQHNREVLEEVGLTDAEITALEGSGVLRTRGSADSVAVQPDR
jgi:crotonobetainyl-CoA:carnitine CoA-transferase CaiB-like acyl-CoA transferase